MRTVPRGLMSFFWGTWYRLWSSHGRCINFCCTNINCIYIVSKIFRRRYVRGN